MLYKLGKSDERFDRIEPLPFKGLPKEKHLEDLIAQNLFDVLFEGNELMPIKQERQWQPEADIYALNRDGDLVIFELKRDTADKGAVHQILRYAEKAAPYTYDTLQGFYQTYQTSNGNMEGDLARDHRDSFDLEHPLPQSAFNQRQHLIIVGSASDHALIRNIKYWKRQGLSIDFIPYRIYTIKGESYFEFFSLPFDEHSNPAHMKGVIFDTNRSYNEDSIWYMCEKARVAAFGDIKGIVHSLQTGDTVFLYHKSVGIVAAGTVKNGPVKEDKEADGLYRELEWETSPPDRDGKLRAMSASKIKEVMGFGFFWAKTMKVPYLDRDQSRKLLAAVQEFLG